MKFRFSDSNNVREKDLFLKPVKYLCSLLVLAASAVDVFTKRVVLRVAGLQSDELSYG